MHKLVEAQQNRKITYTDAASVSRGEMTLEEIVSAWYSFQSLESISKAYKDVLEIDVWKVIRKQETVREKLLKLDESLNSLIQYRHGIVHHFTLNWQLDRDGFVDLLHLVRTLIVLMSSEIETKLGLELSAG